MEGEVADNNVGSDCSSWNDKMMSSSCHSLFSKSQYGQVIFHDLYEIYPTDSDITFRYSVAESVSPQAGDKICLFKLGWSSPNDYLTFHLASEDTNSKTVTFPVQSLPKDENNLYQICYITSGNVTAGASLPFRFKKPNECDLVATEDPHDPDLLVFKSQFSRMQENMSKVLSEKETMEREIDLLKKRLEQALRDLKVYETLEEEGEYCGDNIDDIYSDENEHIPVNATLRLSLRPTEGPVDVGKEQMIQQIFELQNKVKVLEATLESREQDLSHTNNVLLRSYVQDKENLLQELQEKKALEQKLVELSLNHNESVAECCVLREELVNARSLFEALFEEIQLAHPQVPTGEDIIASLSQKLTESRNENEKLLRDYNEYLETSNSIITSFRRIVENNDTPLGSISIDQMQDSLKKKADMSELLTQLRLDKDNLEKALINMKENNAALISRLNVLEIELRSTKNKYNDLVIGNKNGSQPSVKSVSQLDTCISETGKLNLMLSDGISKLEQAVENVNRLAFIQTELDNQKKENEELKERVAYLMSFKEQFNPSTSSTSSVSSNEVESLQIQLQNFKHINETYKKKIDTLNKQKSGLESQLVQLKKDMIGKVTIPALKTLEN